MQAGIESFLFDYIQSLRQLHLSKLVLQHVKVFELKYQSLHIVMRTFSLLCQAGSFSICVHTLVMMLSPVHITTWIWRWLKPWENMSLCCVLTSFPLFHSWRFVLLFCSCLSLFYSAILHSQADSLRPCLWCCLGVFCVHHTTMHYDMSLHSKSHVGCMYA